MPTLIKIGICLVCGRFFQLLFFSGKIHCFFCKLFQVLIRIFEEIKNCFREDNVTYYGEKKLLIFTLWQLQYRLSLYERHCNLNQMKNYIYSFFASPRFLWVKQTGAQRITELFDVVADTHIWQMPFWKRWGGCFYKTNNVVIFRKIWLFQHAFSKLFHNW